MSCSRAHNQEVADLGFEARQSRSRVHAPKHSAAPVCFTSFSLYFLFILHFCPEPSLNYLMSTMFPSAPCVRLGLESRQDRQSPAPCPPFFLTWLSCSPNRSSWGWCGGSNLNADSQETGHSWRNRALASMGLSSG